jgi:hypothetical protein
MTYYTATLHKFHNEHFPHSDTKFLKIAKTLEKQKWHVGSPLRREIHGNRDMV